jgi:hypothetical protein
LPFTPYHFGPSVIIGLVFRRLIDLPVIVLVNVVMDFEPLAVMLLGLDYPLHGYVHTFLIGSVIGVVWAVVSFCFLKGFYSWLMKILRLSYQPRFGAMVIAGVLGVWLHIFLDGIMHPDTRPFWPLQVRPFLHIISVERLYEMCEYCIYAAFVLYAGILLAGRMRKESR